MNCKKPKSEFSAENCETLGPKIKNSWNCNLKLAGCALKEAVHSYEIFSPKFQVVSDRTTKKRGSYIFSGKPKRLYGYAERGGRLS
jgi:hypothetical protein